MKTTTVTITVHTAWEAHGTGAGITARSTVHGPLVHIGDGDTNLIGTDGDTAIGAATDILTLGSMIHGTEDGTTLGIMEVFMTHGTMADSMEDITAVTMVGMVHTTATTSTTAGMTHITTITDTALAILL